MSKKGDKLNCVDVACFQRLCVANLLFSSSLESAVVVLLEKSFFFLAPR